MIRAAIVGLGNVGIGVLEALEASRDFEVTCVVKRSLANLPERVKDITVAEVKDILKFGAVDVAVLCLPSRMCPNVAEECLSMGINTVDSYDIHGDIWEQRVKLEQVAKKHGKAAVISAGWDPGTDSMVRVMMEIMAPKGLTYTNFGPGMSMGHSVAVKAIEGVKDALSMTIPMGTGIHKRMVYVQLEEGYVISDVEKKIKSDPYFVKDETHVFEVADVKEIVDVGHGVHMERKGVSGNTHNQMFSFDMKINNPALTGAILVSAARAVVKQTPGCYTMIELPLINMIEGEKEAIIKRLV